MVILAGVASTNRCLLKYFHLLRRLRLRYVDRSLRSSPRTRGLSLMSFGFVVWKSSAHVESCARPNRDRGAKDRSRVDTRKDSWWLV